MAFGLVYATLLLIATICFLFPAFFVLLVSRSAVADPDLVNTEETTVKNTLKCGPLFLRSLPVSAFMLVLPFILTTFVFPNVGATSPIIVGLVCLHVILTICINLTGIYRAWVSWRTNLIAQQVARDESDLQGVETKEDMFGPQFRWHRPENIVTIITLLLDFFQLAAYPWMPKDYSDLPSTTETSGVNNWGATFFRVMFLGVLKHSFIVHTAFSVLLVLLLLLICTLLLVGDIHKYGSLKMMKDQNQARHIFFYSFLGSMIYGHGNPRDININLKALIALLADTLFFQICYRLLVIFACDKDNHLAIDTALTCWEGSHAPATVVSLVVFSYYLPLCILIAPMFMSESALNPGEKKDISYTKVYIMVQTIVKAIMLMIATFLNSFHARHAVTFVGSMFMCILTWVWFVKYSSRAGHQPCSIPMINMWKVSTYGVGAWSSAVAFIGMSESIEVANWLLAGMLGSVLLPCVWYWIWWSRLRDITNVTRRNIGKDNIAQLEDGIEMANRQSNEHSVICCEWCDKYRYVSAQQIRMIIDDQEYAARGGH